MTTPADQKNGDEGTVGETAEGENVRYLCMKYNRYQEGDQLACQDPGLYCKFRPACLIHFKEKDARQEQRRADASGS